MTGWLGRLRHRRGFGVHSPFAYSFITETLRRCRGYDYYATRGMSRSDKRLYRVLVRLHPESVTLLGCTEHIRRLVGLALPAAEEVERDGRLVVVGHAPERVLTETEAAESHLIVLAPRYGAELWRRKTTQARAGMSFGYRGLLVFVADSGLPRQDF